MAARSCSYVCPLAEVSLTKAAACLPKLVNLPDTISSMLESLDADWGHRGNLVCDQGVLLPPTHGALAVQCLGAHS